MSGVHAYCIVPDSLPVPNELTGIDGAPVTATRVAPVAAWASHHEKRPPASLAAIRAHNDVAAAAFAAGVTPVPLRFGQWQNSEEELRASVAAREADWSALLQRFAGLCEFGIRLRSHGRATAQEMHPPGPVTGTAYLEQIAKRRAQVAARRAESERLAAAIAAALARYVRAERIDHASGALLAIAHLISRADAAPYRAAAEAALAAHVELAHTVTGPWPPYSFVP